MEFAVSAIFLIILLLPGFILQTAYAKGFWRWNSPTSTRSLTEQIPAAIIISSILHAVWAGIPLLFGYRVDFKSITMLLIGSFGRDSAYFDTALNALTDNPYKIFFYFISLYSVAAAIGYVAHAFVRSQRLDRRTRVLRFNNQWFYLLTGEITQFKENAEIYPEVDGVFLNTIVHHDDGDYLYRGVVADFFFDKEGNLDRVLLRLVARRKLSDDRKPEQDFSPYEPDERYYEIEGDFFVLRYSEMSTINIDYIFVTPEETAPTSKEEPPKTLPPPPALAPKKTSLV